MGLVSQDVGLDTQNESDNSDYSGKRTYPLNVAVDHRIYINPRATSASYVGHSIIGEHSAKRVRLEERTYRF